MKALRRSGSEIFSFYIIIFVLAILLLGVSGDIIPSVLANIELTYLLKKSRVFDTKTDIRSYYLDDKSDTLSWFKGFLYWRNGHQNLAEREWLLGGERAAQMILADNNIFDQHDREDLLRQALLLAPQSTSIVGTISWELLHQTPELDYDVFTQAYSENPENPVLCIALAYITLDYNPGGYDSVSLLDDALVREDDNYYVLYWALRMIDKTDVGMVRMQKITVLAEGQIPQDFGFTSALVRAFRTMGNYEKAKYYNTEALKIDPDHPLANLEQVEISQLIKDDAGVTVWLDKAVEYRYRFSDNVSYMQRLIFVLYNSDRMKQARQIFCEGISQGMTPKVLVQPLPLLAKETFLSDRCDQ